MAADHELGQVVPGDVLDHGPPGADHAAVRHRYGRRQQHVAQPAIAQALGRVDVGRDQPADGGVGPGRDQRGLHPAVCQEVVYLGQRRGRADGDVEVVGRKGFDAVELRGTQPDIGPARVAFRRAADADGLARGGQPRQPGRRLLHGGGRKDVAVGCVGRLSLGGRQVGGKDFAGIEQRRGVEDRLEVGHGGEFGPAVHLRHVLALFHADAMFAGDAAVALDAERHDFVARGKDLGGDGLVAGIEDDGRVQIAVARMKDMAHGEVRSRRRCA